MTMTSSLRSFVLLFRSIMATFSICLLPLISFCGKMQNSGPAAVPATYNLVAIPEKHKGSRSGCCSRSVQEKTIVDGRWCWVLCRERTKDSGVITPPLCRRQKRLLLTVLESEKLRQKGSKSLFGLLPLRFVDHSAWPYEWGEWKIWIFKIQNFMPN